MEQRPPLPPQVRRGRLGGGVAHEIAPSDRLDLDDIGAEGGQCLRRRGTGPPGGAVDDADAVERETGWPCGRRRGSWPPADVAAVLSDFWRPLERAGRRVADAERDTWLRKPP